MKRDGELMADKLAMRVKSARLADRRQQFVAAGRHVFAARGFHSASISEIAGYAGLSESSFYRCFSSKDRLIDAVCLNECTRLAPIVAAAWEFGNPAETLTDLVEGIDSASGSHDRETSRRLLIEIVAESNRRPRLARVLAELAEGFHNAMAAMMRASDSAPGANPDDVARVITNSFFGYLLASQFGEQKPMTEYFSSWANVLGGPARNLALPSRAAIESSTV